MTEQEGALTFRWVGQRPIEMDSYQQLFMCFYNYLSFVKQPFSTYIHTVY